MDSYFAGFPLGKELWGKKYKDDETDINGTWRRVAKAVASVEIGPAKQAMWEEIYYSMLSTGKFIPGGRITAGAGTRHNYLLNCCVIGIKDSLVEIYESVKKAAVLAKSNYGVGMNFSKLRPKNDTLSSGGVATGPVSFMKVFDASGSVIQTGGGRRAAQIAVLNISHPDIFEFIDAKHTDGSLTQFNISVGLTYKFLDAVENNEAWDLYFNGKVYRTVRAVDLWEKLCLSGWLYNDPGFLFIDEVNRWSNSLYLYEMDCVNPCGEITLPEDGVCCLGNVNMTKFVKQPFASAGYNGLEDANFDTDAYLVTVGNAVRFLDSVITLSDYPYPEMKYRAQSERRIGLNPYSGLGSTLAMLRIPYDSKEALMFVEDIGACARDEAYYHSSMLAKELGTFEKYSPKFLNSLFFKTLSGYVREAIYADGIRNIALLTVPPVGTGSLIAGNISNGLEPIFSLEYFRKVRQDDGTTKEECVDDYAWRLWKGRNIEHWMKKADTEDVPDFFKTSRQISPKAHIDMQAMIQKYIDNSLSKTCNLPAETTLEEYKELLMYAIKAGVKGFTTFRDGTRDGVLTEKPQAKADTSVPEIPPTFNPDAKRKRERVLDGKTYQIKDDTKKNTYITINSVEDDNGAKKPWEIFLFSKSAHSEWYAAMGVLMSSIMRKVGNVDFIIDDLKEISGDSGYFTPEYGFVGSKPAHIAYILEEYINNLAGVEKAPSLSQCPSCKEMSLVREGGCVHCLSCSYDKCG